MSRVLIVEDSRTQAQELAAILEAHGFSATTAGSAEEGLERLGAERCDLVLTDLNLPGLSGLDLCRAIKAEPAHRLIPVVVLTAEDDPANVLRGLEAGADGFMTKNREPAEIAARLARVLRRGAGPTVAGGGEPEEITFLGERFALAPAGERVLDILASAFEDVVHLTNRLREGERKLQEANERIRATLHNVLDTVPIGIVIVDAAGHTTLANRAARDMLRTQEVPPVASWVEALGFRGANGAALPVDALPTNVTLQTGTPATGVELSIARGADEQLPVLVNTQALRDPSGAVVEVISTFTSIADQKHAEQQLLHSAFHDSLTQLPNRALFLDRLGRTVELNKRRKGLYAVLFLDLDRFKVVNDSLGHLCGDHLLSEVAKRLVGCLRTSDSIARLGGDEFAILLEDIRDPLDATRVAQRLHRALVDPFDIAGRELFTSVSIGIALGGRGAEDASDLLRDADAAMYRAKSTARGSYAVFDQEMQQRAIAQLHMEVDLRRALDRKELLLHYQPIVRLADGKISGFEALVRWRHPERGMVPPGDFIPLAEEAGLIVQIGDWVLGEACRQLGAWTKDCAKALDLTMSVNLSARQLLEKGFVDNVLRHLRESGVAPSRLSLELTESMVIGSAEMIERYVAELKKSQIKLQLDDFGTGYSSLSALERVPFDGLKIDRSFVGQMQAERQSAEIVRASIAMAHKLGLVVVAEGVESAEQLAELRALDCNYAQGFFFSKPVEAKSAEALISEDPRW